MGLSLFLLAIISASGLLLYTRKHVPSIAINLLIALGAGSMLSVSIVHILPGAIDRSHDAVYAFLAGFIIIYLIEELLTPHKHDHTHGDHAHEDPHEHYDHIALVSWLAICIHTFLDGVSIRASMGLSEWLGYAILFGVAVHQIPVSLTLAALLRESHMQRSRQMLLVVLFALSASIGFWVSGIFLSSLSDVGVGLTAAFAGGSLLYVATADLLPIIHSTTRNKYLSLTVFLLGVILMSLYADHGHDEHEEVDPTKGQMEIIR
jgi:zinc transporter ZupT